MTVIAPVERRNQEKMSSFEKDPLLSRQCTAAHLRSFDGLNYGIVIQIITKSTVFTGFGRLCLFLFPNLKKWLGGHRFTSNEDVITQTDAHFDDI